MYSEYAKYCFRSEKLFWPTWSQDSLQKITNCLSVTSNYAFLFSKHVLSLIHI